jgi:hypothetical protein
VQTVAHVAKKMGAEVRQFGSAARDGPDTIDTQFGIDTSGRVRVGALDIPDDRLEHAVAYQPVSSEFLLHTLQGLPVDHERCVFIDIGSFKGRARLLASRHIIGRTTGR